ncbi:hypothetical protein EV426DRAFT_699389 [Tirmania nivea]|nr:hypothetical protein EV426DRAFT_699389 [Tirmania nivea]
MTDSATHQPPSTHSVAELAAELQKMKWAKIWWWQRDDILKARMSIVVMAWVLLASVLTIYLALHFTHRLSVREIHIVLIMLLLLVSLFFLHSLFRLFMATIRLEHSSCAAPPSNLDIDIESQMQNNPNRTTVHVTFIRGPGGYAVPAAPIPIAFPDGDIDEDGDGGADGNRASSVVTTLPPPAYGLWRSSVMVNPDQFYWVRRGDDTHSPARPAEMGARTPPPLAEQVGGRVNMVPVQMVYRPPSYSSEDGVEYVLGVARLPGTAVLAAPPPAPVRVPGFQEMEGGEREVDAAGRGAPGSRE